MPLRTTIVFIISLLPALGVADISADGIWGDVNENNVATTGSRAVVPKSYRLLTLDYAALHRVLDAAPLEDSRMPGVSITLPLPDGKFAEFSVVESPIMAPQLAAKFPELKTYLGTSVDDPTASLRFSVTPQGLHAQILSATGAWYIDPYQKGDDSHHISYARANYPRAANAEPFICHFNDVAQPQISARQFFAPRISSGTQLRTYRVAIAATGEYTNFHGGTIAKALAAIVVALDRVDGIYERDVAVRMILIDNNDSIIYTDAATDPYTNNSGGTMLGQNQDNLDTVIGTDNYDIGHVFSTGGGGIAMLFGPCNNSIKAMGVTGSSAPIGDPFYVDYVAHEMGHQFSANHTFNSIKVACGGGNRNDTTAYEPGSGATIMAYAGICPPDDLQPNSDPYFHGISLEEIVNFITTDGNVCAVTTDINNTPPTADAGSNAIPAYTIPKNTPFQLTGRGSDVDGDALTYTWEEFDLGPAGAPNSPAGSAPLFRSFLPSTNPTRIFPKLTDLLNNTHTIGELLPSYGRDLTFQLTVRDNYAGGGGINQDTIALQVSGSAGPFQVTAPTTAVTWAVGSTQTVTWNVAGTTAAPISCANVNILLSTDGGNNFATSILAATPNDGSQAIVVPNLPTTQARLKVACANNIFFDISKANFTINVTSICGDADGNTKVNIVDALAIARKILNLPPPPAVNTTLADVDRNGTVSIDDALYIARYSVGLITPPEVCSIGQPL